MGRSIKAVAREKERQAVGLFLAGKNFTQIAEAVGYTNRGTAYETVMRAIRRETVENIDEIRAAEVARIDAMLETAWPVAIDTIPQVDAEGAPLKDSAIAAKTKLQLEAQATVLKLMERRAKYLGLESPAKVDVKHDVTSPDDFAAYLLGAREAFDAHKAEEGK